MLIQLKKQVPEGKTATRRGKYVLCLLPGFSSLLKKGEVAMGDSWWLENCEGWMRLLS